MSALRKALKLREVSTSLSSDLDAIIRLLVPPRVPAVYLAHAILAIVAGCAERGMNNLRVHNGADSSIPTAPTITSFNIAALQRRQKGR
jgi:hypothetical protein